MSKPKQAEGVKQAQTRHQLSPKRSDKRKGWLPLAPFCWFLVLISYSASLVLASLIVGYLPRIVHDG